MKTETPKFFANRKKQRLFSVLHKADDAIEPKNFSLVQCAPIFEERLWSHRVMVNFARYMAMQGVDVLRFDYFGDGESEGNFEDASVLSRVDDVLDAVEHCRAQTGKDAIYVLGLGYGATMALCAGLAARGVAGIVGWAPVMDGSRYIGDILRAHLSAQMVVHRKIIHDREALIAQLEAKQTVNVEGYEIGFTLYKEMIDIDLTAMLHQAAKPVALMQIAPTDRAESQYAILKNNANAHVEFAQIKEAKFWTQQKSIYPPCTELFAKTAAWLAGHAQS